MILSRPKHLCLAESAFTIEIEGTGGNWNTKFLWDKMSLEEIVANEICVRFFLKVLMDNFSFFERK